MTRERFLVTGAFGCIGAWVVRQLVGEGVETAVFDLTTNPHRLKLLLNDDQLAQLKVIQGDITDGNAVARVVADNGITHIIHLAALQVPFCKANPALGASVNVVGTVNIFEAARLAGLSQIVYASSIAVYGLKEEYPAGPLAHDAPHRPRTLYGAYKSANEATARVYYNDHGISSVTLRPYTVYGPARDQGMTSTPTQAMLAAALGQPYHISFGGRCIYNYTQDTARAFVQAARLGYEGAGAFNLPGTVATMAEVVAAIQTAVPHAQLTYDDIPLPFPEVIDEVPFHAAFGSMPFTSLQDGVAQTVALFREAVANGRLAVGD
jgi:nucleoside-diphosphate-sugar epimerase